MPDASAFAASVAALIGRPLAPDEPFAVAVSGGPDSLALLLLAHAAFGARVRVLTLDHGLRAASAAEARHVAAICADLGVPHATLRWDEPKPAAGLQAAAREARYRLMAGWCAANGVRWLAAAHHADDVAETLLMRLARGSGLSGLAAMRPVRPLMAGVMLLRPLLDMRRADLARLAAPLRPVDDPSNRDPRFDRTKARDLLRDHAWLAGGRVAASASHLRSVEEALAWTAEQAWRGRAVVGETGIGLDAAGLPGELVRRLVLRALAALAPAAVPRGEEVDRLIAALSANRPATLAGVHARPDGSLWRFSLAPPRRPTAASN